MEQLQQLTVILKNFDLPFYRLTMNKNNLVWLSKNLKKKNSKNIKFQEAQNLINYCLTNHLYTN